MQENKTTEEKEWSKVWKAVRRSLLEEWNGCKRGKWNNGKRVFSRLVNI